MNQEKSLSPSSRKKSVAYALNGLWLLFRHEPNAKIHAVATIAAIGAGIWKHISSTQWTAIIFAIALVWITEAINTCIEKLCDYSCEQKFHPTIKIIKDISAAAVLVASLASIAVAVVIFIL